MLWGSITILLVTLGVAYSVTVDVLNLRTTAQGGFPMTAAITVDKDGNGKTVALENLNGNLLIRSETRPSFMDPDAHRIKENNFLYLPYIDNPNDNRMLRLAIDYRREQECDTYTHVNHVQCYDNITVLLVATTSSTNVSNLDPYAQKIWSKVLDNPAGTNIIDSVTELIEIPANTQGYRFVVHDQGSSFLFTSLLMQRLHCRFSNPPRDIPMTCPDVQATNLQNTTVTCTCSTGSSPSDGQPITMQCVYNSQQNFAEFNEDRPSVYCQCDPGYVYTVTGPDTRECIAQAQTTSQSVTTTTHQTQTPVVGTSSSPSPGSSQSPGSSSQSSGSSSQSPSAASHNPSTASTNGISHPSTSTSPAATTCAAGCIYCNKWTSLAVICLGLLAKVY